MLIKMQCNSCGAALRASDDSQGQSMPCPKCGVPMTVPLSDMLEDIEELEIIEPLEVFHVGGSDNPNSYSARLAPRAGQVEPIQALHPPGHIPVAEPVEGPPGTMRGKKLTLMDCSLQAGAIAVCVGLIAAFLMLAVPRRPPITSLIRTVFFMSFVCAFVGGAALLQGVFAIRNTSLYGLPKSTRFLGIYPVDGTTAVRWGRGLVVIGWVFVWFCGLGLIFGVGMWFKSLIESLVA